MLGARRGAVLLCTSRPSVVGSIGSQTTQRAFSKKPELTKEEQDALAKNYSDYMELRQKHVVDPCRERAPVAHEPMPNPEEVMALDPMPHNHVGRRVTIAKPARSSMTSGPSGLDKWHITVRNRERWSNPLMGWTSSADTLSNLELQFDTAEDAVNYCNVRGWKYVVNKPQKRDVKAKYKYAENFLSKKAERDIKVHGTKSTEFAFPTAGQSYYERPLTFHGDGQARQHGNAEN